MDFVTFKKSGNLILHCQWRGLGWWGVVSVLHSSQREQYTQVGGGHEWSQPCWPLCLRTPFPRSGSNFHSFFKAHLGVPSSRSPPFVLHLDLTSPALLIPCSAPINPGQPKFLLISVKILQAWVDPQLGVRHVPDAGGSKRS